MLTTKLDEIWKTATMEEKMVAQTEARIVLENLTHYPSKKGRYFPDDIQMLAAKLLWFRTLEIKKMVQ